MTAEIVQLDEMRAHRMLDFILSHADDPDGEVTADLNALATPLNWRPGLVRRCAKLLVDRGIARWTGPFAITLYEAEKVRKLADG